MIPVAAHFRTRHDACAAIESLRPEFEVTEPEDLGEVPLRPWVLVISVRVPHSSFSMIPRHQLAAIRRAVALADGELDETRLDDPRAVFQRLAVPLPPDVIERYYRDNPHLRPRGGESVAEPEDLFR